MINDTIVIEILLTDTTPGNLFIRLENLFFVCLYVCVCFGCTSTTGTGPLKIDEYTCLPTFLFIVIVSFRNCTLSTEPSLNVYSISIVNFTNTIVLNYKSSLKFSVLRTLKPKNKRLLVVKSHFDTLR